jgi:hypothetical protein
MNSTDFVLFLIFLLTLAFYLVKRQFNYWKRLGIQFEEPNFPYGNLKGLKNWGKILTMCENFKKLLEKL